MAACASPGGLAPRDITELKRRAGAFLSGWNESVRIRRGSATSDRTTCPNDGSVRGLLSIRCRSRDPLPRARSPGRDRVLIARPVVTICRSLGCANRRQAEHATGACPLLSRCSFAQNSPAIVDSSAAWNASDRHGMERHDGPTSASRRVYVAALDPSGMTVTAFGPIPPEKSITRNSVGSTRNRAVSPSSPRAARSRKF